VLIRFSELNIVLKKCGSLTLDGNLVFKDEGPLVTVNKFLLLTMASPLAAVARLVRSVAFLSALDPHRAGREFIGAITPLVAATCLLGSLISPLAPSELFHIQMRRTYATFEAWVNGVDLSSHLLPTYSNRVSNPLDVTKKNWTTAPCLQPVLENGTSSKGGIFDVERMKKLFPKAKINGIFLENGKVVIQSEYSDKDSYYTACNGAYEHGRLSKSLLCCFRINAAYDRFLCFELGQGNCSSIDNFNDICGITFCGVCGIGVCCCHAKLDDIDHRECSLVC